MFYFYFITVLFQLYVHYYASGDIRALSRLAVICIHG